MIQIHILEHFNFGRWPYFYLWPLWETWEVLSVSEMSFTIDFFDIVDANWYSLSPVPDMETLLLLVTWWSLFGLSFSNLLLDVNSQVLKIIRWTIWSVPWSMIIPIAFVVFSRWWYSMKVHDVTFKVHVLDETSTHSPQKKKRRANKQDGRLKDWKQNFVIVNTAVFIIWKECKKLMFS